MPVQITRSKNTTTTNESRFLTDESGNESLVAQTIRDFLESVDWGTLLRDEDVQDVVSEQTIHVRKDENGKIVPCDEMAGVAADFAFDVEIEIMDDNTKASTVKRVLNKLVKQDSVFRAVTADPRGREVNVFLSHRVGSQEAAEDKVRRALEDAGIEIEESSISAKKVDNVFEDAREARFLLTPGSVAEKVVDRNDLAEMFDYYLDHELGESMDDKLRISALSHVEPSYFTEQVVDEEKGKKKKKKTESIRENDAFDRLLGSVLARGFIATHETQDNDDSPGIFVLDEMSDNAHRQYLDQVNRKLVGSGAIVSKTRGHGFGQTSEAAYRAAPKDRPDITNAVEAAKEDDALTEMKKKGKSFKREKDMDDVSKKGESEDYTLGPNESIHQIGSRLSSAMLQEMDRGGTARGLSSKSE